MAPSIGAISPAFRTGSPKDTARQPLWTRAESPPLEESRSRSSKIGYSRKRLKVLQKRPSKLHRKGVRTAPSSPTESAGPESRSDYFTFAKQQDIPPVPDLLQVSLAEFLKSAGPTDLSTPPQRHASIKERRSLTSIFNDSEYTDDVVEKSDSLIPSPQRSQRQPGREPPPITGGIRISWVGEKPRHVEIKIPPWAQPAIREVAAPPRISLPNMSQHTPDSSRTNTMDSNTSAPSPNQFYANRSNNGSNAQLSSVHSSQSSLVGLRQEYESASESESVRNGIPRTTSQAPSHSTHASLDGGRKTTTTHASTQQLSGLVCNVHRTTGREPRALVGATTTILGDKLYVFGGRKLSRSKPQLTANLYELDLLRRHWTKLDVQGDIPPPRYFHSVCALGDTKLVCYGGMSPPTVQEPGNDPQSDVVVMSDIHIYDVKTRTWTKISTSDAPQGRYAHCAAILPSSAVFASTTAPASALHHNPGGDNANQGSLGIEIDGTGGAEMVVVGGQDGANHYIEQMSVFNLRSLKWTSTASLERSCGAYRSVVAPLTTMESSEIGAGSHPRSETDDDEDDEEQSAAGSGAPLLVYSNYNFLDVKLELQVRNKDGTFTEKPMQGSVSPPGLRFPNGAVIDNHFVVSGTFLTSSKQEYALWALDLRTLAWSRIDAGTSIFSQGSWNRGILWPRRNTFVVLGNRKRSLVDDYNNRRINFTNICLVELEAFGLYNNPRRTTPTSKFLSASSPTPSSDIFASGRDFGPSAELLGAQSLYAHQLADMDLLTLDGSRIPVNSRIVARRWGPYFLKLLRESLSLGPETDNMTLRPGAAGHPFRNSSLTITQATEGDGEPMRNNTTSDLTDIRSSAPHSRPRLLYLPHTPPTVHALVHYLYTSSLPAGQHPLATTQIFCSLLQLARPYKIDGLLEAVMERLHESLDGRTAAAIFNAAAMSAGGGSAVQFTNGEAGSRESVIPLRAASLAHMDALGSNGSTRVSGNGAGNGLLRIDTDMANGRPTTRNTLRPGQLLTTSGAGEEDTGGETTDEETPQSATTDASMSESDASFSSVMGADRLEREIWSGVTSAVVGLQKRGLRGLMEGHRMRDRAKAAGEHLASGQVGLGIV